MKKMYVFIIAVLFAAVLSVAGKAFAFSPYYNNYYVSLNGGIADTSPSGLSSTSGGTYNITLGKNYNFNNVVIGAGALLGYADNGSYTYNNYDGYGYNVKESLSSAYYGVFVKGGYAFNNIMPFVKLGYIGYSFDYSTSYSGLYGNSYSGYTSPIGSEGGLLYGAGIEYMINPSWGVTAQYFGAALSGSDNINNFTVGIDFNF